MVKASNLDRLRAALTELDGRTDLTLEVECRRAGVARATANRDNAFMAQYRAVKAGAGRLRGDAARQPAADTTVSALRGSIDLLANAVQALTLANQQLETKIETLAERRLPKI